jgi:hypothetical protein
VTASGENLAADQKPADRDLSNFPLLAAGPTAEGFRIGSGRWIGLPARAGMRCLGFAFVLFSAGYFCMGYSDHALGPQPSGRVVVKTAAFDGVLVNPTLDSPRSSVQVGISPNYFQWESTGGSPRARRSVGLHSPASPMEAESGRETGRCSDVILQRGVERIRG